MTFEHFEHGADVGVRGRGATAAEAFAGAACALFSLVAEDLGSVRPETDEHVSCEAEGLDTLLVAFLNELISLADSRRLVFGAFDVSIRRGASGAFRVEGRARGERFDPARHAATVEPKGATFTELSVAGEAGRWVAQCVVDV
jgi:SHS2 domain-containing protein